MPLILLLHVPTLWVIALLLALLAPVVFGLTTGKGNHYAQIVLDYLLGSGTPATWYGALLTTDPTDDDGTSLVEVTTGGFGGYARVSATNNSTNFPASSVVSHIATKSTGAAIDWGTSSGGSGVTIVGVALYDASTSGNLGYWGPLASNKTVNSGDGFKINSGNLTFTEQ